jgi:hypothetical protein
MTDTGNKVLELARLYETSILDKSSHLSAHFVVVPALAFPDGAYMPDLLPEEELGLLSIADVPLGGVVRSLAELLRADDVERFSEIFRSSSERDLTHRATQQAERFAFAEYLTFARILPTEGSSLISDSLGNVMTKQPYGAAQFVYFEEAEDVPIMYIGTSEEMLMCATISGMSRALHAGLRERLLQMMQGNVERS